MGHNSEQDLKEIALPLLKEQFSQRQMKVVEEFSYSAGRTDLVFTFTSDKYLSRRVEDLGISIPITDKGRLKAFLRIHKRQKEITKDYYYELSSGESRGPREHLEWLINNNFVVEVGDNRVRTAKYLRKHITKSIAVELKLTNWKRALEQAIKGRAFSEYQYVVMDADYVSRAEMDVFEKYGVGLISISERGELTKHVCAEKQSPFSALNSWRLNEVTLESISG